MIPLFISCASLNSASNTMEQVYIGMTLEEFKIITGKKAKKSLMRDGYNVYTITDYDFMGYYLESKSFYFDPDDKLIMAQ